MSSRGTTGARVASSRVTTARALAWLGALLAAIGMLGLVDLGTVLGLSNPAYEWEVPLEASWGSLFTFVIGGGFAWIGSRPLQPWPGVVLLGLASGSMIIAAILQPALVFVPAFIILYVAGILALLRPEKPAMALVTPEWSAWAVVNGAGVALWLWYTAVTVVADVGGESDDVTNGLEHGPAQAALGLTMATGTVLLLLSPPIPLWRWIFAATAFCLAYANIAYPERGGAMPTIVWPVLIALWGLALLVVPRPDAGVESPPADKG